MVYACVFFYYYSNVNIFPGKRNNKKGENKEKGVGRRKKKALDDAWVTIHVCIEQIWNSIGMAYSVHENSLRGCAGPLQWRISNIIMYCNN